MLAHTIIYLAFAASSSYASSCYASPKLAVNTTVGTVHGMINGTHPGVAQYLGIPYAEPPLGDLRWERPVPKTPSGGIDATILPPSCPQFSPSTPSLFRTDAPLFNIDGLMSEDCLALNVWAPVFNTPPAEPLPVIVFLHGGGLQSGGARIEYQNPTSWVQRSQTHIVVQINYRLNIFSFPSSRGHEQSFNLGLLDQRLGLEWIRCNIANFGGDPSKITLWGQSGGAIATDYYNFAYPEDPIIKGIIMASSSAYWYGPALKEYGNSFSILASHLGCRNMTASLELDCMKKIDAMEIENFLGAYYTAGTLPRLSFPQIVDNETVFENYTERYRSGKFSRVPAIHGLNSNEGASLSPWINNGTTYNETAANAHTVRVSCSAQRVLHDRYDANATTYHYYYTGNFSTVSPRAWQGAYHSAELPLIFGTHDVVRGPASSFEYAVSHRMQDMWLAFMKDPDNGLRKQGWPAAAPNGQGIEFGHGGLVEQLMDLKPFREICDDTWVAIPGTEPVDRTGPLGVM